MGRGGGKNGYAGYLNFYMLSKQFGIDNYHVEWIATSEQQAKTTFEDVKNVIEKPANDIDIIYLKKYLFRRIKLSAVQSYLNGERKVSD